MLDRMRQAKLVWPTLFAAAALAVLLGLGTWQFQRKTWKEGLQREIDARAMQPPVPVADAASLARLPQYTRVKLTGSFRHDGERYLFSPDQRYGSGSLVFTPLMLPDGSTVMVNRGFVPDALRDPIKRAAGQPNGTAEVVGLVREPEVQAAFVPPNDAARNLWYWRDIAAMAGGLPRVAKVYVDAAAEPANPGGWPKGGGTIVQLPNKHTEYMLTWYGIALTLVGVYVAFVRGRLKALGDGGKT